IGIEDFGRDYHPSYDLKTNETKSQHEDLTNFIATINTNETAASVFKKQLEAILDVDSFLRYEAINTLTSNPDSFRNWYNNYYLYFDSKNHRCHFIPYDYDHVFGTGWFVQELLSRSPFSTKTRIGGTERWQDNPLFWRLICESTETDLGRRYPLIRTYQEQFRTYLIEFRTTVLNYSSWAAFASAYQYHGNIHGAGAENWTMSNYMDAKNNGLNQFL
ncbi:MAG: CotH kinase family protein, partial [Erysipelotrichaceae bacterium]|nr:CotH kinase family protein [Erysipelotrichaceae bacterium]